MEPEQKLYVAIKKVLVFIESGPGLHDDTILHLLLDGIKCHVSDQGGMEQSGIPGFIERMAEGNGTRDSDVFVFCIKLAAFMGEKEDGFVEYSQQISQLISTVRQYTPAGTDPSVTTAMLQCLTVLARHRTGLYKIVTEYADIIWTNLTDQVLTGWFLQQAKRETFTTMYVAAQKDEASFVQEFAQQMLKSLIDKVHNQAKALLNTGTKGSESSTVLQCFENSCSVLESLLAHVNDSSRCQMSFTALVDDLANVIVRLSTAYFTPARTVLTALLHCRDEYAVNKYVEVLNRLCQAGDIQKVQMLAFVSVESSCEHLQQISQSILLELLWYIVNQGQQPSSSKPHFSKAALELALSNRGSCVQVFSTLVLHLNKVKLDCTELIVHLLRLCTGNAVPKSLCPMSIQTNLYNSVKLEMACLQYLRQSMGSSTHKHGMVQELFSTILDIIDRKDIEFSLYSECTKCLVPLLPRVIGEGHTIGNLQYYIEGQTQDHDGETENQLEGQIKGQPVTQGKDEAGYSEHQTKRQMEGQADMLMSRLSSILQYHLSALHWEIRDTTLEFLTAILKTHTECAPVIHWVVNSGVLVHVWHCVTDGESYVRASAITTLLHITACDEIQKAFYMQVAITQEILMEKIVLILKTDTEAFARRSAVTFLLEKYRKTAKKTVMSEVCKDALSAASNDFDWQVKITSLHLCQAVIEYVFISLDQDRTGIAENNLPLYAGNLGMKCDQRGLETNRERGKVTDMLKAFDYLCDCGVIDTVLELLTDYDEQVTDVAVTVMKHLQSQIWDLLHCYKECKMENTSQSLSKRSINSDSSKRSNNADKSTSVGETKRDTNFRNSLYPCKELKCHSTDIKCITEDSKNLCQSFLLEIVGSSLNCKISTLESYIFNETKLVDILSRKLDTCGVKPVTAEAHLLSVIEDIMSTAEHENEEENVIDCY